MSCSGQCEPGSGLALLVVFFGADDAVGEWGVLAGEGVEALDGLVLAVGWELANLVFREPLWFQRGYAALFDPSSPSNYSRIENRCQRLVFPQVECYWDGIIPSNDSITEGAMSIEDSMLIG